MAINAQINTAPYSHIFLVRIIIKAGSVAMEIIIIVHVISEILPVQFKFPKCAEMFAIVATLIRQKYTAIGHQTSAMNLNGHPNAAYSMEELLGSTQKE